MGYLLLSIVAATLNAAILKRGELLRQNRLMVMGINYVFAAAIAGVAWALGPTGAPQTATLVLGAIGGFFFAVTLFILMAAIGVAGLAVSMAAYRMGLVWPVLTSLVVFGEIPSATQAVGILLALVAIVLLAASTVPLGALTGQRTIPWLLGLFFGSGGPNITMKVFSEVAPPEQKMVLLTLIFGFAALFCWGYIVVRRLPLGPGSLISGAMFGTGNVTGNLLLLFGLESVPGVLAFPIVNTGILLLASLFGVTIWGERPGRIGYAALAVSAVAIVLMTG